LHYFTHFPEADKLFTQREAKNWLERLFREALIDEFAALFGKLNMMHPFREGNGRALRLLFEFIIVNAGYEISWSAVDEKSSLRPTFFLRWPLMYQRLVAIFDKSIGAPITD
jgi:cell filamentation protein